MVEVVLLVLVLACAAAGVALACLCLARMRRLEGALRLSSLSGGRAGELSDVIERQLAQGRELQASGQALSRERLEQMAARLDELSRQLSEQRGELRLSVDAMRQETASSLEAIRSGNDRALESIRSTVDEKLQQTLDARITQSFRLVNDNLRQVEQGLGEMQSLAADVGGLRRALSNVKVRGIVGETQLGAILREVLAPAQYAQNVATAPGSDCRVEFAVRLPGEAGETVWLPIDAKFPGDAYEHLRAAADSLDAGQLAAAWRTLEARLVSEARDIHEKYVAPPATTSFAIMFLPFEGLYAEVVGRPGLVERLQREWRVSVAGPSTMAAMLNSLQMGFQTVAIQRRAHEVQLVLSAVKTEFATYQGMLAKASRQLGTASKTIDALMGTRMRAMERRLREVGELDEGLDAAAVLGIETPVDVLGEDGGSEDGAGAGA